VKFLAKSGVIRPIERDGVRFESGPNAILLSELPVQGGRFCNLGEFPVLQMLYRQGMILPRHPNNTGLRPMIVGLREQVVAQSRYVYLGNYGLTTRGELAEASLDARSADEHLRMKLKFAFGAFRKTEEFLDLRIIDADAIELRNGAFVRRLGVNRYEFIHGGESAEVDLNLPPGAHYGAPYALPGRQARREAFSVVHLGEGDGWDVGRPCMGSLVMYHGEPYLVDAGPNIEESLAAVGVGIGEIAGIFHTHAHDDHFVGLTALLRAERRVRYYAVPCVRLSVARKLAAVSGIAESDLDCYFDVRDLQEGRWNNLDGLEVFPSNSPHPVENTTFRFRVRDADRRRSYAHLADLASFSVLDGMVTEDTAAPGISREYAERAKTAWLEPADVKKIDAGGGLIHGAAEDFAADGSGLLLISHTSAPAAPPVGRVAAFGEESVLVATPPVGYPAAAPALEVVADPEALAFLRSTALFGEGLSSRLLVALAATAKPARRATGTSLLSPEPGVFILAGGSATLLAGGRTVAALGIGEPFGEESLLSENRCFLESRAEEEVAGWILSYAVLKAAPILLWRFREVYERRLALAKNVFDFRWRDEYSVGVKAIDEQHRKLFGLLGEISGALSVPGGCPDAREGLAALTVFAAKHFRTEEDLMREAAYPGAAEHGRKHEALLVSISSFLERLDCSGETRSAALTDFLKDWLLKHTLLEDRRYMPWLARPGF
jgi:hemerythrin-like metal-binding protein